MLNERLVRTLVLAAVGLTVFAILRPSSPDPLEDARAAHTRFFVEKTHRGADYDAVIVGDSRGLRGISPAIVSEPAALGNTYNLSFHAGGMNAEMYDVAEGMLRPDAARPTIVLAPTSLSFLPFKRDNAQFHEYRNKPRDQVWLYLHAPFLAEWFQPVSPSLYLRRIFGPAPAKLLVQTFHRDGWIETDQTPHDDLSDLTHFRLRLEDQASDPELIRAFMARTTAWVRQGIRVAAFIPPAYPPRVALEDSMLGFDPHAFAADFVAAGGTWLDFEGTDLDSYDGSHLTAESARAFSRRLGEFLRENLAE